MKLKLLNILTVCFVTLGVLAPALLVFGLIWERHIELVKTHYLVYEVQKERLYAENAKTTDWHKQTELLKSYNGNFLGQIITPSQPDPIAHILSSFIFFNPMGICLGISLSDRYRAYRAAVFKEQVETLERLWQQSIHH